MWWCAIMTVAVLPEYINEYRMVDVAPHIKLRIRIRTYDKKNPILLWSFGGFGLPEQCEAVNTIMHQIGVDRSSSGQCMDRISRDFTILTYDYRGQLGSAGTSAGRSIDTYENDLVNLVAYATVEYPGRRIFLGGHSLGADLAINTATRLTRGEIDGIVLIAPSINPKRNWKHQEKWLQHRFETTFIVGRLVSSLTGPVDKARFPSLQLVMNTVFAMFAGVGYSECANDLTLCIEPVTCRVLDTFLEERYYPQAAPMGPLFPLQVLNMMGSGSVMSDILKWSGGDIKVTVPVLHIHGQLDAECDPQISYEEIKQIDAPNITNVWLDGAHNLMLSHCGAIETALHTLVTNA